MCPDLILFIVLLGYGSSNEDLKVFCGLENLSPVDINIWNIYIFVHYKNEDSKYLVYMRVMCIMGFLNVTIFII